MGVYLFSCADYEVQVQIKMATPYTGQDCIVQHGGRHDSSSISLKGLFHATEIGQSCRQFQCKKPHKSGNTDLKGLSYEIDFENGE